MLLKLKNFIRHPTSKDVFINSFGNYLSVGFTVFFALLLVRIFGLEQYGVLSVLLGIAYVLANVMDFGTTATIYSYLPPLLGKKPEAVYRFIKSTFFYQTLFALIIIAILLFTFPYLDRVFFKTGALKIDLYLTAIMVIFLIWQNFSVNLLLASKKFLKATFYLNLSNLAKTLAIFVLMALKSVSIGNVIFVFGIFGPLVFLLLLFLEKKERVFILWEAEIKREEFRFGYTLTYFIANQFLNLGLRMDLFLLSFYGLKTEVGLYALAQKIVLTIITAVTSITQVLSPGFSQVKTKSDIRRQLKTGFLYLLIPVGIYALLAITPNQIFDIAFTARYLPSAPITRILALPFIIYTLINLPLLFLLYTVKKPWAILVANISFFIIFSTGCYLLIPLLKIVGVIYSLITAFVVMGSLLLFFSWREFKKIT